MRDTGGEHMTFDLQFEGGRPCCASKEVDRFSLSRRGSRLVPWEYAGPLVPSEGRFACGVLAILLLAAVPGLYAAGFAASGGCEFDCASESLREAIWVVARLNALLAAGAGAVLFYCAFSGSGTRAGVAAICIVAASAAAQFVLMALL